MGVPNSTTIRIFGSAKAKSRTNTVTADMKNPSEMMSANWSTTMANPNMACQDNMFPSTTSNTDRKQRLTPNGNRPVSAAVMGSTSVLNAMFLISNALATTDRDAAMRASEVASHGPYPLMSQIA